MCSAFFIVIQNDDVWWCDLNWNVKLSEVVYLVFLCRWFLKFTLSLTYCMPCWPISQLSSWIKMEQEANKQSADQVITRTPQRHISIHSAHTSLIYWTINFPPHAALAPVTTQSHQTSASCSVHRLSASLILIIFNNSRRLPVMVFHYVKHYNGTIFSLHSVIQIDFSSPIC